MTRTRVYRTFPGNTDKTPNIAHGRTDDRGERIRRPYASTPRRAADWR